MTTTAEQTVTGLDPRVAAGAGWLDENRPGWAHHINPDAIDMNNIRRCVLGQIEGRIGRTYWTSAFHRWPRYFTSGQARIRWCARRAIAHGFLLDHRDDWYGNDIGCPGLTAQWRTAVRARRAEHSSEARIAARPDPHLTRLTEYIDGEDAR